MATRNRGNNSTRIVVPQEPLPGDHPLGAENGAGYDEPEPEDLGDLATLVGESFQDAVWYVYRRRAPGEVVNKTSNPNAAIYVGKMVGELDLEALAKMVGGGSFKVCGYRGNRKFIERPFECEGPRKRLDDEPAPAPAAASPVVATDASSARIDRLEHMLGEVLQHLKTPAAPAAMTFADVIQAAKLMQPQQTPATSPDKNIVDGMIGMLKQGIELGASRESGGSAGVPWLEIIDRAAPIVGRAVEIVAARGARRPMPPGQVPRSVPPGRPDSSAEVVDAPPAAPVEQESPESVRMAAVVDALARAIDDMGTDNELDPAAFADSAEMILSPAESAMLRMASVDSLMGELTPLSERFPAFGKPQAREYVDAVLSALKSPSADAE